MREKKTLELTEEEFVDLCYSKESTKFLIIKTEPLPQKLNTYRVIFQAPNALYYAAYFYKSPMESKCSWRLLNKNARRKAIQVFPRQIVTTVYE